MTTDQASTIETAMSTAISTGANSYSLTAQNSVSKLTIPQGINHLICDTVLLGQSTSSQNSILEVLNITELKTDGKNIISGGYVTNYGSGLKIWANTAGGCSLLDIEGVDVIGAPIGIDIGDISQPDALVSELNVSGTSTHGCPNPLRATGTQTVAHIADSNLIASYGEGTGAWLNAPLIGILSVGANVTMQNGELLQTSSTATTSYGAMLEPIQSEATPPYPNRYGTLTLTGVTMEIASTFIATSNPSNVSNPVGGAIIMQGCTGIHTQNLVPLIVTDPDFSGDIRIDASNNIYSTVPRTVPTINAQGPCNIYVADGAFGANFPSMLAGITGAGHVHFSHRLILDVSNLEGQALPNGEATVLKYQNQNTTGDLAYFAAGWNASQGTFTIIAPGGVKGAEIAAKLDSGNVTDGQMYISVNGTPLGFGPVDLMGSPTLGLGDLNFGDIVSATLINIASGPCVAGSTAADYIKIWASA